MPRELGSSVTSVLALAPNTVTAGGGSDNIAQNGPAISRLGYYAAVLACPIRSVLAAGANVVVNAKIQSRSGGGSWSDLIAASPVTLSSVGGGTVDGILELNAPLDAAGDEIRAVVTPNLSAANTDTATLGAVLVLGESSEGPV